MERYILSTHGCQFSPKLFFAFNSVPKKIVQVFCVKLILTFIPKNKNSRIVNTLMQKKDKIVNLAVSKNYTEVW